MSSIYLHIYDLSRGLARQLSFMFIGKHIEGVWHTGIVAYGREWFYGGNGVESVKPKGTILNEPDKIEYLGDTQINENDFLEMIEQLSEGPFRLGTYHLLRHNCNTFSNQMAQFLLGKTIPQYIIDLPNEVLNTPIGGMLESMFAQSHTLKSNVDDVPVSHITKNGKTLPLSSSIPSIPFTNGLTATAVTKKEKNLNQINESIKYKPEAQIVLNNFISNKNKLNLDENQKILFDELVLFTTKTYLEETNITWSIGKQHVKFLFNLFEKFEDENDKLNIIKIFQIISNDKNTVKVILSDSNNLKSIIDNLKTQKLLFIEHYLQFFSNMVSNYEIIDWFMNEQEFIFQHLTEFILHDIDSNKMIHQYCITFFYNLICTYDGVYAKLNESSGLSLGCALIELIHSEKFDNSKLLLLLDLLQVCCAQSNDLKIYIESVGGLNLNKYIHDEKCKLIIETINKHLLIKSE